MEWKSQTLEEHRQSGKILVDLGCATSAAKRVTKRGSESGIFGLAGFQYVRCPEHQYPFLTVCKQLVQRSLLSQVGIETRRFGTIRSPRWIQSRTTSFEKWWLNDKLNELICRRLAGCRVNGWCGGSFCLKNVNTRECQWKVRRNATHSNSELYVRQGLAKLEKPLPSQDGLLAASQFGKFVWKHNFQDEVDIRSTWERQSIFSHIVVVRRSRKVYRYALMVAILIPKQSMSKALNSSVQYSRNSCFELPQASLYIG